MKTALRVILLQMVLFSGAYPWSEHGMGTYPALEVLKEMENLPDAETEELADFLWQEKEKIQKFLDGEEKWLEKNIPKYPPLPAEMHFDASRVTKENIVENFFHALRINPGIKVLYYVYIPPGKTTSYVEKISGREVSIFPDSDNLDINNYYKIKIGQKVKPMEILATASDEPDYGHDIGIWEDNGTAYGIAYKLGKQPFGDPRLEYSSQAPMHMGFYHEAWIVRSAAGYLKRTYPEYRIRMFASLARFAKSTGHDYWSYRFGGWGLHYVEDLTMPYHSTVLPGVWSGKMVWIATKKMVGFPRSQNENLNIVSNRHCVIERFQRSVMRDNTMHPGGNSPVFAALQNTSMDKEYGKYNDQYPRKVVAKESNGRAKRLARRMEAHMPDKMMNDPTYNCENDWNYPYTFMKSQMPQDVRVMEEELAIHFQSFGAHARNYVRGLYFP